MGLEMKNYSNGRSCGCEIYVSFGCCIGGLNPHHWKSRE
jgi:hypothetical protein